MFDLDIRIFNFIYSICKSLGNSFGYGALEGAIMYFTCICGPAIAILEKRKKL